MFLLVSVMLSTGGSASVHAGIPPREQTPPQSRHTPKQTPPLEEDTPPVADTPRSRPPRADPPTADTPLGADTPQSRPPWKADSSIWSMSSRYASYWNAFLLHMYSRHFLTLFYHLQRSCSKVMFLHLSVSHSVNRVVSASVHAGIHSPGLVHPPGQVPPGRDIPTGQVHPSTVTAADGTHPTGMLSCCLKLSVRAVCSRIAFGPSGRWNMVRNNCKFDLVNFFLNQIT